MNVDVRHSGGERVATRKTSKWNLFQGETLDDVQMNYEKLKINLGKWNADTYIEVLEMMRKGESIDFEEITCPRVRGVTNCFPPNEKFRREKSIGARKAKYVNKYCWEEEAKKTVSQLAEVPVKEPAYKKIFKNARERAQEMKVRVQTPSISFADESGCGSAMGNTKNSFTASAQIAPYSCELLKDEDYNVVSRKRNKKEAQKIQVGAETIRSFSAPVDDVDHFFQEKPVLEVLQNNLRDNVHYVMVGLRDMNINEDVDLENFRDTNFKAIMLGNQDEIDEFQKKYEDPRWRNKFDFEKLEVSDELDSTDESLVPSSGSPSMCSGDSTESWFDFRNRPPKPSRIPYFDEVHDKNRILFDKISRKWEKVVRKNLLEPNDDLIPEFSYLYSDCHIRGHVPFFKEIKRALDDEFPFYGKTFTPYKVRKVKKESRISEAKEKANARETRQATYQNIALLKKPYSELNGKIDWNAASYQTTNQRRRLRRILKETEKNAKEQTTVRDHLLNDYVNLYPMIATKRKREAVAEPENELQAKSTSKRQELWYRTYSTTVKKQPVAGSVYGNV